MDYTNISNEENEQHSNSNNGEYVKKDTSDSNDNKESQKDQSVKENNPNEKLADYDSEWTDVKKGLQVKCEYPNSEYDKRSVDKSVTSNNYTISKAPSINCKVHGKSFIGVDTAKFSLVCHQCQQEGRKGNFLEYQAETPEEEEDEDNDYKCNDHPDVPGIFYCDDCKYFLCKLCFANNHRTHYSNIPSLLGEEFKTKIKDLIEKYNLAKPKIEEAYNGIVTIYNNIKKNRDESIKRVRDMITNVSNINKNINENLIEKLKQKFMGLDIDIEDAYNRLVLMSKKINKFLTELEDIARHSKNLQSDPVGLCAYNKSKAAIFNEIKILMRDSKQMLDYKIESLKAQIKENIETFKKQLAFTNKQTTIFEKSILTSINAGTSNSSIVLRRFTKFSSKGLKYYKTSSVLVKVNKGAFLSGIGLCGLYLNSTKRKQGDYKSDIDIPINIAISEMKLDGSFLQKMNEHHKMNAIINRYDPTFLTYFKKGAYLKPGITYMISITNLDKNNYVDIWTGEASKKYLDSMEQTLSCNCTNVEFTFKPAKDVESDLNEFNSGVIGSLIYSYTKSF
jgi:hypothetical protein